MADSGASNGGMETVMEALQRLALRAKAEKGEEGEQRQTDELSLFGKIAEVDGEEGEGEDVEEEANRYLEVDVLEEPCKLTFHEQNWAFKFSAQTSHLRSQGYRTPHMAVQLGREDLFWWLVNHDEDWMRLTQAGDTILHIAAQYGHLSLVQGIFERFGGTSAPYDKRLNEKATNGAKRTALHLAAAHGHLDIVKYLVEVAKLSIRDRDNESYTPLMAAAQRGHLHVIKYLHQKRGGKLSDAGQYKYTALLLAAYSGHFSIVKYIMRNGGSNKEVTNLVNTALHVAAMGGHCEIVQFLLTKYSTQFDVSTKNSNGQSPLHLAVWSGHEPLTRLLVIEHDASLTATNAKGNTPFLMACLRGHLPTAMALIQLGAQFTERNRNGNSALLLAAYGGHNDIINWLLDPDTHSGLSLRDTSTSGNTALLHASSQALLHTVKLLIEQYNAPLTDTNNSGRTALDLSSSYAPIHSYIQSRLAKASDS